MMLPVRWSHSVAAVACLMVVCMTSVGCSSSGSGPDPSTSVASPIPRDATTGDLACGFLSHSSIAAALGRSDFTVTGALSPAAQPNPDGTTFSAATCKVSLPDQGDAFALDVTVAQVAITDQQIVNTAGSPSRSFTYPSDTGAGFASYDSYHDAKGNSYKSCQSGLVRGDWTVTLGVQMPGPGRDSLNDTVALAESVVATLKIPLRPTKPYPWNATSSSPS